MIDPFCIMVFKELPADSRLNSPEGGPNIFSLEFSLLRLFQKAQRFDVKFS